METIILQQFDNAVRDVCSLTLSDNFKFVSLEQFPERILDLITLHHPVCIIVDLLLDGSAAVNALKLIRKFDPGIPVVAMSCNFDIAKTSMSLGFDAYVAKPFEIKELMDTVVRAIAAKHRFKGAPMLKF